jgi:hypothetical protein
MVRGRLLHPARRTTVRAIRLFLNVSPRDLAVRRPSNALELIGRGHGTSSLTAD